MEFVCYNDWESLPANASELFAEAEKDSLFFSRLWFEELAGIGLAEDESLLLACVVEGEHVFAILPLVRHGNEALHSLKHRFTPLYTLLLAGHDQSRILASLVEGLRQLPFRVMRLDPVAESDTGIGSLQKALETSGFSCYRKFGFYNWVHQLKGQSFESYLAERPSRVRNTIARKRRKLEREHGYEIRLFTGVDSEQVRADYNSIYRSSWKANELIEGYIEHLLLCMSRAGWLRLAILYIAEKPAAAQVWFVAHGKASIFRLVYDQNWKQYSPGTILTGYLMEHVIVNDRVEEIDFLTGNDAYKQDWMTERRERWTLICEKSRMPASRTYKFSAWIKSTLPGLKSWQ